MRTFTHHLDGQARGGHADVWLEVFEPRTQQVYARVARGDEQDVGTAVQAASRAAPAWSALPGSERARWLERLADAIEASSEAFIAAEAQDTGKPEALCRDIEIPRAISNLRFFAAAAQQFGSESHHGQAGLNYTLRQPLGVVACISPWNLPLYLLTWKIAPALAAGNTVVAKPSEVTPNSADLLMRVAADIGFPPGVLNLVQGLGAEAGEALVRHDDVKAVSFTGSTAVGRRIAEICASQLKKCSLELGGKNATLVFADAPREALIPSLLRSAFQNSGQICLCGSRLLIERSAYAEVRDGLLQAVDSLQLGPMTSAVHHHKVMQALRHAEAEGGRPLCGGAVASQALGGWSIAPTIYDNLSIDSDTAQQEIFGPVLTLHAFDDEAEALAMANATRYGLAASVWTENLGRAHRLAEQLQAGIVWVNTWMRRDLRTPFGGVKDSGMGREGGMEAMRFFTEPKNVCLAW